MDWERLEKELIHFFKVKKLKFPGVLLTKFYNQPEIMHELQSVDVEHTISRLIAYMMKSYGKTEVKADFIIKPEEISQTNDAYVSNLELISQLVDSKTELLGLKSAIDKNIGKLKISLTNKLQGQIFNFIFQLEAVSLSLSKKINTILSKYNLEELNFKSPEELYSNLDKILDNIKKSGNQNSEATIRKITSMVLMQMNIANDIDKLRLNVASVKYLDPETLSNIGNGLKKFSLDPFKGLEQQLEHLGLGKLTDSELQDAEYMDVYSQSLAIKFDNLSWDNTMAAFKQDIYEGMDWQTAVSLSEQMGLTLSIMNKLNVTKVSALLDKRSLLEEALRASGIEAKQLSISESLSKLSTDELSHRILAAILCISIRYNVDTEHTMDDFARIFEVPKKELILLMNNIATGLGFDFFSKEAPDALMFSWMLNLAGMTVSQRNEYIDLHKDSSNSNLELACLGAEQINNYVLTQLPTFITMIQGLNKDELTQFIEQKKLTLSRIRNSKDQVYEIALLTEVVDKATNRLTLENLRI